MNLDNPSIYKKYDKDRVAESIELLPDQMRQVLEESRLVKVPRHYSRAAQVVVNGMGGSNLGTHITRSAWSREIKVPITITPGYDVPAHVNEKTLYLISSYSGTTEEPLSVYREVKKRGAKVAGITLDSKKSKLYRLMMREDLPGYIFRPEHNPSGQPRLGLGYSIFGQAVVLARAGLFEIKVRAMEDIIASLEIWTRELRANSAQRLNPAKRLAGQIENRVPILIGAEHLAGNLHVARNQINECSKSFAGYLELPDLNHYAMEGLMRPKSNQKNLVVVFFDSALYRPAVRKRLALTEQVVKKNRIKTVKYELKGANRQVQSFELLQLGSWLSFYLGILYRVNPAKIPYVDWFKEQLKK